ncbi:MAG: DNA-binding response regulator [Deltaproteobacteria bacterium]|jgi:DNA-binding response OmpR family regulator|nr:DNA-binding response regulator [Deltaproteobacteria bacterium]
MSIARLVVVEDDPDLRDVLRESLTREGYEVSVASDGVEGLALIRETRPALVCLDVMMPGKDGIEVCRELRADAEFRALPILMLTAKGDESDVVLGLGIGADDYMVKPARPKELVARVRALLRRGSVSSADGSAPVLEVGPMTIDEERFEVRVNGEAVQMTPTEFQILQTLAKKPGRVFRRSELLRGPSGASFSDERTVDAHVRSIRQKLGSDGELVQTVRGKGYRIMDDGS